MLLTETRIQHYKSLADVTVNFDPNVTVFVGSNAVGKSNFVDALRFLRDAACDGLDHALTLREGIVRVRQASKRKPYNIAFNIEVKQRFKQADPQLGTYTLRIKSLKDGNFKIDSEAERSFREDESGQLHVEEFSRNQSGEIFEGKKLVWKNVEDDELTLGSAGRGSAYSLIADSRLIPFIESWRFCNLYPNALKELRTPDKDSSLREDGTNWASVIQAMKRSPHGKNSLDRIYTMMRTFLPSFLDVSISKAGSYLVPKFRFSEAGQGSQDFDPVQLSDGTLRVFGILLSLYQRPPVLVIEEPEQTIHPGVLAMLAEAFKEASETTQIIVTTHSPQLVDHFETDQIRVVSMQGGETCIAGIKQSQRQAIQRHLMSVGEFMLAEGLQPQLT